MIYSLSKVLVENCSLQIIIKILLLKELILVKILFISCKCIIPYFIDLIMKRAHNSIITLY